MSTMCSPASVGFWPTRTPASAQRLHLGRGGALAARDDGAGVAHLLAGGRGDAGDVGRHRLGHLRLDELGGLLLGRAADLADHHHGLGLGVGLEGLQAVDEAGARHGVAADADAGGHADVLQLELVERLVGEGAGAAHDADRAARLGDLAGGDADVGLAGADDAGAVRAEDAGAGEVALHLVEEPGLVLGGHALGDDDDQLDAAPRPPPAPRPSRPGAGMKTHDTVAPVASLASATEA